MFQPPPPTCGYWCNIDLGTLLYVSDSRYTSPPDEAQIAKETDTMHTEVVACRMCLCSGI